MLAWSFMIPNAAPRPAAPFRLAAIDLDDTLLCPRKRIAPANAAAICELRERGVQVVLASGRRHESMAVFHQALGLEGLIVSSQGALVRCAETERVLHQHPLPPNLAAEIVAQATACGATLIYYHMDAIYVARKNRLTALYAGRGNDSLVELDLNRLAGESPLKIIWMDDPAPTTARFRMLSDRYRGVLDFVITSPEYLEITAAGVSKAAGLAVVAAHYDIKDANSLAFGDADNDVTMLRWAGFGIAMNAGTRAAKAAANAIAPPGDPAESFARAVRELIRAGWI